MFIAIVITDVLLLAIVYLMFIGKRNMENSLSNIFGKLTLLLGNAMHTNKELEDFRKDFLETFDDELRKKLTAVFQIGERPDNMMKRYNTETGKDELVPIDHGW